MNTVFKHDKPPAALLLAAGSLRAALDDMIAAYAAAGGESFETLYGPSGGLRQHIETGTKADAFASASLRHLAALADQEKLEPPAVFARNTLCVVLRSGLRIDAGQFVEALCDPALRVATSTPGSDPMGDYTWQLFRNIDALHPGAFQALDGKAMRLSGARIPAADESSPYFAAFAEDRADAYIMYSTNALVLKQSLPQLQILRIPAAYDVRCEYGIAAGKGSDRGRHFAAFALSADGQQVLRRHGFELPQ